MIFRKPVIEVRVRFSVTTALMIVVLAFAISPIVDRPAHADTWIVSAGVCRDQQGLYPKWSDYELPASQCQSLCEGNSNCQGFASHNSRQYCQLFGSDGSRDASQVGTQIIGGHPSYPEYTCHVRMSAPSANKPEARSFTGPAFRLANSLVVAPGTNFQQADFRYWTTFNDRCFSRTCYKIYYWNEDANALVSPYLVLVPEFEQWSPVYRYFEYLWRVSGPFRPNSQSNLPAEFQFGPDFRVREGDFVWLANGADRMMVGVQNTVNNPDFDSSKSEGLFGPNSNPRYLYELVSRSSSPIVALISAGPGIRSFHRPASNVAIYPDPPPDHRFGCNRRNLWEFVFDMGVITPLPQECTPAVWDITQNAMIYYNDPSVWSFKQGHADPQRYAGSSGQFGNFVLEGLEQTIPDLEILDIRSTSGTEENSVSIALSCKTCQQPTTVRNGHWRAIKPDDRPKPPVVE